VTAYDDEDDDDLEDLPDEGGPRDGAV